MADGNLGSDPPTTGKYPIDADALSKLGLEGATKVNDYITEAVNADTVIETAALQQILARILTNVANSQGLLAMASDITKYVQKSGAGNTKIDDHAKIIQTHLHALRDQGIFSVRPAPAKPGVVLMSKLSKDDRDKMPKEDFGDPDNRMIPINDQEDADASKAMADKHKDPAMVKKNVKSICKKKDLKHPFGEDTDADGDNDGDKNSATYSATSATVDPDIVRVEFAADMSGRRVEGNMVVIPCPVVFRCGDYPDKSFSLTPEEAQFSSVPTFPTGGVDLDLEHKPTVLSGKLGVLSKFNAVAGDPWTLAGECKIPLWLDSILGPEERKLSVAFHRQTKQVIGCGIVRNPRITDAGMMAAFAAAETEAEAAAAAATAAFVAPVVVEPTADQKLRDELALERKKRIDAESAQFADAEIMAKRAMPSKRDHLISMYVIAAKDDLADPTPVEFSGAQMTRVQALKSSALANEPHLLDKELLATGTGTTALFNRATTPNPATSNAPPTEDRRKELLERTVLGRSTLANKKK